MQLWNVTEKYNLLHPRNWTEEVTRIVRTYQAAIIHAKEHGYDGHDIPKSPWTFSGALLYSITVITTIGEWSDKLLKYFPQMARRYTANLFVS